MNCKILRQCNKRALPEVQRCYFLRLITMFTLSAKKSDGHVRQKSFGLKRLAKAQGANHVKKGVEIGIK